MPRYRITISSPSDEAMLDLVRTHKINVSDHSGRHREDSGYVVQAIAEPAEIHKLKALGYQVKTHEDVDVRGKERRKEVGQGNRYIKTKAE